MCKARSGTLCKAKQVAMKTKLLKISLSAKTEFDTPPTLFN